jgi:hypothetical protein
MKLEFSALNGLLHTALTYLCQQDCVIPGAPAVPLGTAIRLELHWPEGEQPIEVKGRSLGLDPGGRGLRLEIDDPVSLHQVVMMMTHLHFGPHVGKRLLERSGVFAKKQTQEFAESEAELQAEPPPPEPMDEALEEAPLADSERTQLPSALRPAPPKLEERTTRPPLARPPRLRPPVIRPPRVRPPAAATELPRFSDPDPEYDLSQTAIAVSPELLASLDDLDDDY